MKPLFIKNFTSEQLEAWVHTLGEKPFRARQLFRHLYARNISSWSQCTDLSRAFRAQLEFGAALDALAVSRIDEAPDGTRKYLFRLHDGNFIEIRAHSRPAKVYALCIQPGRVRARVQVLPDRKLGI